MLVAVKSFLVLVLKETGLCVYLAANKSGKANSSNELRDNL